LDDVDYPVTILKPVLNLQRGLFIFSIKKKFAILVKKLEGAGRLGSPESITGFDAAWPEPWPRAFFVDAGGWRFLN